MRIARPSLAILLLASCAAGCAATVVEDDASSADGGTGGDAARDVAVGCTIDLDGDGVRGPECGGLDCDDADPSRFPGNPEVCDALDRDEDCDPTTYGVRDLDRDGEPDATCCNADAAGALLCGTDCDDLRATISPRSTESCNGLDDDCDASMDEGVTPTWTIDADGDGHGSAALGAEVGVACSQPAGYAATADDCDDAVGSIHPGAYDACDGLGVDDDCSGAPDDPPTGCACGDGEARACMREGVCAAGIETCVRGAWGACSITAQAAESACDGRDEDCDGAVDDGMTVLCFVDEDTDGYPAAGAPQGSVCPEESRVFLGRCPLGYTNRPPMGATIDCDDAAPAAFPGAPEVCDRVDQDCDGALDEGVASTCWVDTDGDGFAAASALTVPACGACPAGTTPTQPANTRTIDCNEGRADVSPGQSMFFATAISGTNYDYDCNGTSEREYPNIGSCTYAGSSVCAFEPGFMGAVVGCGAAANDFLAPGASSCRANVSGTGCNTGVVVRRTQRCR